MLYLLQWGCPENTVPWLHFSGIVSIKMNSPHALQKSCPMEVQFPFGNAFTRLSKRLGCQSGVLCNPRDHGDPIAMFNVGRACSQTQSHVCSKTSKHLWGWPEGTRLCTCLAPQHPSLGALPLNWEAWMAGGCLPVLRNCLNSYTALTSWSQSWKIVIVLDLGSLAAPKSIQIIQ